jgi:pseudaminic acid synthase
VPEPTSHIQDEPMFVAEMSANHLGDKNRALKIIEAAASSGASAVKFQTYKPETMTLDLMTKEFCVRDDHPLWPGRTLFSLYEEAQTPWEWHQELFEKCRELNVVPFSSPFDLSAVEFLESLNCPMYKIASLETSDHRLIRKVAETGKPVIISTGATELSEVKDLVEIFYESGNKNLTLLVCTSNYPALPIDANIARMETLRDLFEVNVGISDHTLGIGVAIAAIGRGATMVEKHFTLRRSDQGADSAFSMEPEEFELLVREGVAAHQAIGRPEWKMPEVELESRRLRRSIYVVKTVKAGDKVSDENIKSIRPGYGMSSSHFDSIIGRTFNQDLLPGTPMKIEYLG